MRTSYDRFGNGGNRQDDIYQKPVSPSPRPVQPVQAEKPKENTPDTSGVGTKVYEEINEELEKRKSDNIDELLDEAEGQKQPEMSWSDVSNAGESKKKKMSTGKKVAIGFGIAFCVVAVAIGLLFGIKTLSGSKTSLSDIDTMISKMYTSKDKSDIKSSVTQEDVNKYYMDLMKLQKKNVDVSSEMAELDTIGYYIEDSDTLMKFGDASYDLTTAGMQDTIEGIETRTSEYSVPGLAVTINSYAEKILSDYDYFVSLRQELNGIEDVMFFDEEGYKTKIDAVTHTPNNTELNAIYDKLVVDKQAAQAQAALDAAKDEESKAAAEKALQDAQELQKKTQEELDNTKKQLEEKAQEAADAIKNLVGGSSKEQAPEEETPTPTEEGISISPEGESLEDNIGAEE